MQFIPRRTHLVARERILRRTTLRNNSAVELLDRDSFWGGHCALVRRTVGRNRGSLLMKPGRHPTWRRILRCTFEVKEAAAAYDCCFNFLVALPTIHAAVSLNDSGKKIIQYKFSTSEMTMFDPMLLKSPHPKRVELLLKASDKTLHLFADQNLKAFVHYFSLQL